MINCNDVTVAGGPGSDRPALDGLTLSVEAGEIVALAGAPGSGKTALLRAIAGLDRPASGTVTVDGVRAATPAARGRVGYVRAGLVGLPDLTAIEWLRYLAAQRRGGWVRATRVQAALALVGLGREADRRLGSLDRDAAEQVAVATAALGGSAALLLDECLAGIRAVTRRLLTDALTDLALQGRAVLLAPRDVAAAEGVATRVLLLRQGRVLADLRMTDLQRDRVADLTLNGGALAAVPRLLAYFPDAVRTGAGVAVPLHGGRSLESVLAVCRDERIAVVGSRVRYRAVEDLVCGSRPAPDPARAAALG